MDIEQKRIDFENDLYDVASMGEHYGRAYLAQHLAHMTGYIKPEECPYQKKLGEIAKNRGDFIKYVVDKYFPQESQNG